MHGRGGSTFLPILLRKAAEIGESIYVDDGNLHTLEVHVDNAAEVFNGTGSKNLTVRDLAHAIGAALQVPVRSVSREEGEAKWGNS